MRMGVRCLTLVFLVLGPVCVSANFYGDAYYNDRYGSQGIDYTTEDRENGLWSSASGLKDHYLLADGEYQGDICTGCTCDDSLGIVVSCTGPTVELIGKQMTNITAGTFADTVTSIKIMSCPNFEFFEDNTFENLTSLQSLIVQDTILNAVPDISNTAIKILNLAANQIVMNTNNYAGWSMPSTITHIALMDNLMHWVPPNFVSGPVLRMASFSNNQIFQIDPNIFGTVSALTYLGFDGNVIKRITKRNLEPLASALNFYHFNCSNNIVEYVDAKSFNQIDELKIIELHQNSLTTIKQKTFSSMANLLHLDLHANDIEHLPPKSFEDLPFLMELRLHSQKTPMKSISYDAWTNIGDELINLFVSDNQLPSFPHPVMEKEGSSYPKLERIFADNNVITNATGYGSEAFPLSNRALYKRNLAKFHHAFTTYPALHTLYLHANLIPVVENTDYCNMTNLQNLYLSTNLLTETSIDDDAFACVPILDYLDLAANQIQYVPRALTGSDVLPSITTLVLNSNKLTFLETGIFSNHTTLTTLEMDDNGIIAIEDGAFPDSIVTLELDNNEFRFLHQYPFANLQNLAILHLGTNHIDIIPEKAFENCTSLSEIHLYSNNIMQLLQSHFANSPLTGDNSFASNDIGWIEDGTFAHVTSMSSLDLSNNKLNSLPTGGDFEDLSITHNLDLSSNRINILPTGSFKTLVIGENLLLSDNQITKINTKAFDGVSITKSLDLQGNPTRELYWGSFKDVSISEDLFLNGLEFTNIPTRALMTVSARNIYFNNGGIQTIEPQALYDVTVSKDVDLSNNILGTIQGEIFGGSSSIGENLNLQNNSLTYININAFDNVALTYIMLTDNLLTVYPQALLSQNPERIFLDNNQLTIIPPGSLAGMTNLNRLNLNNNQLDKIEAGLFDDLTGLRNLHLDDNVLEIIEDGVFDNMASLLAVYASNNLLTNFPAFTSSLSLQLVDISNNNIETLGENIFATTPIMTYLYLGGNPVGCYCQLIDQINTIKTAVMTGECEYPVAADGITLNIGSELLTTYFANSLYNNGSLYQCTGENVAATAVSGSEITVTWDQPPYIYVELNATAGPSPSLNGSVTYTVTCVSVSAATLEDTLADTDTTSGSSSFSMSFTTGVEAGTTYECSIKMERDGYTSAKSAPAIVVTPDAAVPGGTAGPSDIVLDVIYYDFSNTHSDFDNSDYINVGTPTYVASPYGAWLSISNTPSSDTFSEWYRFNSGVNYEITSTMILAAQTGTIKRYSSNEFFPVDGLGYTAQQQLDCNFTYHNFGFTSVIRTGLVFAGTEKITVGGGEGLWLYINKILVIEIVSSNSTATPECYKIDLSPAANTGGGTITPEAGVISGGVCTAMSPLTSGAHLELEVGEIYHFDLFHAETMRCYSKFLFEVEDTTFMSDPTTQLPLDYAVTIAEDFYVDDNVQTLTLTDVFSQGSYEITLYNGNEARLFEIKEDTVANQFTAPAVVPPTYRTILDLDGNTIQYVECNATANTTATNDATDETFSITTSTALLTLKAELDYEATTEYYLLMTVVDQGLSPALTGSIAIRITITDVNDNCPVLTPTTVTLTPIPVLVQTAYATFATTDADSGVNADIHYVVSAITEDPPVNFNESFQLWEDVYLRSTTLQFEVIAMDNGTIPRGMSALVNVTVSITCVMDVEYESIDYKFVVNDTTGEMFLRIPRYWVYLFDCLEPTGLENGDILDIKMSASSSFDDLRTAPGRARLNHPEDTFSEMAGAWVAGTVDQNQYVEVDTGTNYKFRQVHIQGRADAAEWVTSYKLHYYDSGTSSWVEYTDSTGQNIFLGNVDNGTVSTLDLDPAIFSQKIRVNPWTWNAGNISMRLDFSGCDQAEQLFYDVSCVRCETSYYCEGDGLMHMCGRCENNSVPCDRDPSEHSYGLALECTTCPDGHLCHDGYASICPDYHYVDYCNSSYCPTNCTQCEPGYACRDGKREICDTGKYSDGYLMHCASCAPGSYQNQTGQASCIDCAAGFYSGEGMPQCNRCKPEEYSLTNGSDCISCLDAVECPCLTNGTCFSRSNCFNTGGGNHYCGACPWGYQGDGITCTDIDECSVHNVCFGACLNTEPGYQCYECPEGYTGTYEDAEALTVNQRVFEYMNLQYSNFTNQTCYDIDECGVNNGGCDPLMPCVNTPGSYYCDFCMSGYIGTLRTGCVLDNFCISGAHDCNSGANCIYLGPALYRCECKPGYAGNGEYCGVDSDNDGIPDTSLSSCTDWVCGKDNCPSVSNSNQEDTDGDAMGDNCDNDDDSDGRYDYLDNCQFVKNTNQTDSDGDGVGDVCDNCPSDSNTDQLDSDEDGIGDECDTDDDDDGYLDGSDNCPTVAQTDQADSDGDGIGDACDNCVSVSNPTQTDTDQDVSTVKPAVAATSIKRYLDGSDNCPTVAQTDQADSDGDGIGDACDNCVSVSNPTQTDTDQNGVGDACDTIGGTDKDEDGDGILDFLDNCPSYANGDQSDIDGNGEGDLCDADIDGDGILNSNDTCVYLANPAQTDTDGDGIGDDCEDDADGDGIIDKNDTCPYNPSISKTSFKDYFTVDLYPGLNTTSPSWLIKANEGEVMQTESTGMPTMLIGKQSYGAIEYRGTWFVTDSTATDYVGFVFGYQNNRKFYLVTWKSTHSNYDVTSTYRGGIKGIQLKLVDSTTGPSEALAEALWHSYDTTDHVTLLWQDPLMQGWEPEKSYRWILTHQPSTGYIHLQVYRGYTQIVDSGDLYDPTISGGRVGVFQFGEFSVIWSYLKVLCQEHLNQGLYLDGVDDYVELDNIPTLKMEDSFTFEVWLSLDSGYTTGPYPIICSEESTVCLWVESGVVNGRYGDSSVTGSTSLTGGQWHNIIFRHSIEDAAIAIFVDGVLDGTTTAVTQLNFTILAANESLVMYIGKENTTFFRGTIDEVRLYSVAILDAEITEHIGYVTLSRTVLKSYGHLHFTMEESSGATTLTNAGVLSAATANLSGGRFVTSYQQYEQFKITYPNNRR